MIDYNFGIDDVAESKFGIHKQLIVLNSLEYKCCVIMTCALVRSFNKQ